MGSSVLSSSLALSNSLYTMVYQVESKDDFKAQLVSAGDKLVVVDFYATWCGPCKMIAPKIDAMSKEYTNVVSLRLMWMRLRKSPPNTTSHACQHLCSLRTEIRLLNLPELTKLRSASWWSSINKPLLRDAMLLKYI